MTIEIVLSRPFDVAQMRAEAAAGLRPRHVMADVADAVDGRLWHLGTTEPGLPGIADQIVTKITGTPGMWSVGRELARRIGDDDVVFCPEIFGFVFATLCALRGRRPRLIVDAMAPSRPRVRFALRRRFFTRRIDRYLVNSDNKVQILRDLGIPAERISIPPHVVDEQFMVPKAHEFDPHAPVVVSSGREQRDYATFAEAIRDSDLVVRVCAVSANVTAKQALTMPDDVPANMEIRHFEWPDYQALFQSADVVVVPLLDHDYCAGLTVIYEAFAFDKPVIVTRTTGVVEQLIADGVVIGVPPGDPIALRAAIDQLVTDDELRIGLADRGRQYFLDNATTTNFIEWMTATLAAPPASAGAFAPAVA